MHLYLKQAILPILHLRVTMLNFLKQLQQSFAFLKPALFLIFPILLSRGEVRAQDEFERFRQQQQRAQEQFTQQYLQQYNAFVEADRAAFEQFKEEVEKQWGEFIGSTRKDWVEYSEDLQRRSRVDFEHGQAEVEVLLETSEEEARAKLKDAVVELISDQGTSSDYKVALPDGSEDAPQPLDTAPVLQDQVADQDGAAVTPEKADAFAQDVAQSNKVVFTTITGKDGQERMKATAMFPLVPDHLEKRAGRYLPTIRDYAQRYDLDVPLICAVIHTESFFNPKARSPIPALGLMQLVPKSGGREAYRFVYKDDRILPPSYFYDPKQNIELGSAYLHLLRSRFFAGVEDDQKAQLCVIAGYNTGPGNVSRALTGETVVSAALPIIANMHWDKLYEHLKESLPYKETRDYLVKVLDRISLYEAWR